MQKIPLSYIGHFQTVGELLKGIRLRTDAPLDQIIIEEKCGSYMLYELKFDKDIECK